MKTTDEYLRILRNGKTYLMQAYHITRLGVFGSVACSEQKEISALESVQREIIQNITRAKYGLSETGENKREKIFD